MYTCFSASTLLTRQYYARNDKLLPSVGAMTFDVIFCVVFLLLALTTVLDYNVFRRQTLLQVNLGFLTLADMLYRPLRSLYLVGQRFNNSRALILSIFASIFTLLLRLLQRKHFDMCNRLWGRCLLVEWCSRTCIRSAQQRLGNNLWWLVSWQRLCLPSYLWPVRIPVRMKLEH